MSARRRRSRPDDDAADGAGGAPWLEAATVTLLAASVVLALVPATEAFAPVPWFVGTLLVLLSRRWGAGDKALAVLAFGVLGRAASSCSAATSCPPRRAWSCRCCSWRAGSPRRPGCWLRAHSPREQGRGLRMR